MFQRVSITETRHCERKRMSMQCPTCGNDLPSEKIGGGFCPACEKFFSKEHLAGESPVEACPDVSRGRQLLPLIPKLPSTLAIMLDEYTRQKNDYVALYAMCAALEITARFLTVIILADVR